jgi:hypothetical protein
MYWHSVEYAPRTRTAYAGPTCPLDVDTGRFDCVQNRLAVPKVQGDGGSGQFHAQLLDRGGSGII